MRTSQETKVLAGLALCLTVLHCGLRECHADILAPIQGGNQWKRQFEQPSAVRVEFWGSFSVLGTAKISLGGVSGMVTNFDYTSRDSDPKSAYLRPFQTYPVLLSGTNVYGMSVAGISVPSEAPKLASGGQAGAPQQRYRLYIWSTNGITHNLNPSTHLWEQQAATNWSPLCSGNLPSYNCEGGNCNGPMTIVYYIQMRPDGVVDTKPNSANDEDGSPWDADQRPIDAPTAPGDGEPVIMSAGRGLDLSAITLGWNASMGRLWNGASAGKVRFMASRLDTNAFTPLSLHYASPSSDTNEVDVRMNLLANSAYLQQIKTPQTLLNVGVLSSNSFDLKFYLTSVITGRDTNGFFILTNNATPFVTWQVDSPDGSTNKWRLREIRNSQTNIAQVAYVAGSRTWTLTNGTGNEARVEVRTVSSNVVSSVTNRTEVLEVKNGAIVSDRTTEVYRQYDWGMMLTAVTNDPGGSNFVTSFTYGNDTNSTDYQQLTFTQYPDGFWEERVYAYTNFPSVPMGALYRIIQPWQDSPTNADINDCLVTELNYGFWGSYSLKKWHDPASFGETSDSASLCVLYGEWTWIDEDECGSNVTIDKWKRTGETSTSAHTGVQDDRMEYFGPQYGHLSGQIFAKWNEIGMKDAYDYQFGQWNAGSKTFATVGGATNDVRQIIYHGNNLSQGDLLTIGDSGMAIADSTSLIPFKSTKDVKIIDDGNLAAFETYLYTGQPSYVLIDQVIYERDRLGHATNVFRIDPKTSATRTIYKADWTGGSTWPVDLKVSETDETGTTNLFTYDSLKRVKTKTKQHATIAGYPSQSDVVVSLSYDAAGRILTNTVTAGGLTLRTISSFDLLGKLKWVATPDNLTTRYAYLYGGKQTEITYSSGATQTNLNFLDRRLASITGSAVTNQFFAYSLNHWSGDPLGHWDAGLAFVPISVSKVTSGATNSLRYLTQIADRRGVLTKERRPAFQSTNELFTFTSRYLSRLPDVTFESGFEDGSGNLDDIPTHFTYDPYGAETLQSTPVGTADNYWADPATMNRMTSSAWYYATNTPDQWFRVSEQYGFLSDNSTAATLLKTVKERITGFAAGEASETLTYDANTNLTDVKVSVDLANTKVTTITITPESSLSATNIVVNGLLQTESTPTVSALTWRFYDALGRETSVQDPLGFTVSTTYDPTTGQVTSRRDRSGQTTTYTYYAPGGPNAGMLYSETGPTGKKTYYKYNERGQLVQKWGDVPYPEQRLYSMFGEMTNLLTYRGGSGWTGSSWPTNTTGTGDVTQWFYDGATGLLTNKTDAAGKAVSYTYYNNWALKTRTWARGVTSTNYYNEVRDLTAIAYSDGSPTVTFTNYTRLGLPRTTVDGSGTNTLIYDQASRLVSTTCGTGLFAGITVSNHFNRVYGRDVLKVTGSSPSFTEQFAYDSYGRLSNVWSGVYSAGYVYLASSDLLRTTSFRNNGTDIMTTTRSWEYGSRLGAVLNQANGVTVTSHSYRYDALNRRTQALLEDGSMWGYSYNDRNELIGAGRFWPDWSPASGQQFGYGFDNIGNRNSASSGGDVNGQNLRTTSYSVNNLNQYTNVVTPGYEDIIGLAFATNTVTVNSGSADRKGEYFHREITIANASGPVWQNVAATAGSSTTNGGLVFPDDSQRLTFDLDGNLISDGIWTYDWDGENRLKAMVMTNVVSIPSTNRFKLNFVYDYQGRRVQKIVSTNSTGNSFVSQSTNRFVYDGWNLVATLNPAAAILQSFLWGQDLSGTMNGAGGIGGLIAVCEYSGGQLADANFCSYDGNGNVTALTKASNSQTTARYEYSPFGEVLRATGPMAKANAFRFSTKFWDEESGLVYYGYRFYSPSLGRWISRDPSEEAGSLNLFASFSNNPYCNVDPDGRGIWNTIVNHGPKWVALLRAMGSLMNSHDIPLDSKAMSDMLKEQQKIRETLKMARNSSRKRVGNTSGGFNPEENTTSTSYDWKGRAASVASALGLIVIEAKMLALDGAISHVTGASSLLRPAGEMYADLDKGDQAYADLDAISASIELSGGAGSAATMAWGVFSEAADAYSSGW